jgi:hypothetical protein
MKNILPLLFILCLVVSTEAKQPAWFQKLKQVRPFVSSKTDVERIFPDAKLDKSFVDTGVEFVFYDTAEGKMSLRYSAGKCTEIEKAPFDLEKGRVLGLTFFPVDRTTGLSKFNVNKKEMSRDKEDDIPVFHYYSEELGIDYGVVGNKVIEVQLFPALRYAELKCSASEPFRNFRSGF